jgi:GT2 family glycosyltransferase
MPWEIMVVDNGSTDRTREIVEEFAKRARVPTRYLVETRRGKSRALNTGIAVAEGEWILFTDDDVRVSADWLQRVVEEYARNPGIAGLGGRVELHDPEAAEVGVRRSRRRETIGHKDLNPLNVQIIGCNMSMPSRVLREIGGFDEGLGPGSPRGHSAEELDLLYRLTLQGRELLYSPDVLVYHDHGRSANEGSMIVARDYARGRGAFYWKYIRRGDRWIARQAFWEAISILKQIPRSLVPGSSSPGALRLLWWVVGGAMGYAFWRRSKPEAEANGGR